MTTAPPRMATTAVYEAPNTLFVLKQFPLRPVRRGEVLVRVSMSTICRSDIHSARTIDNIALFSVFSIRPPPYPLANFEAHRPSRGRPCAGADRPLAAWVCGKQSGWQFGWHFFGATTVAQDKGFYDFDEFSLVPNVDAFSGSPLSIKHWPSGVVWHFKRADDGTLTGACDMAGDPAVAKSLKSDAYRACDEILERLRKEQSSVDPVAKYR